MLSHKIKVQECDATDDQQSVAARFKKMLNKMFPINKFFA